MSSKPPIVQKTVLSPTERISKSFKQLAASSIELNAAAEELCKHLVPLNTALKDINLGVSAWHKIAGRSDEDGYYWSRDIGYAQIRRKWGIALRKIEGCQDDNQHEEETWLFHEAPRWMQIESVGKLPDLFDELFERTEDTIKKVRSKSIAAQILATAIYAAVEELKGQRKSND